MRMSYPGRPLEHHDSFRIMHLKPGKPGDNVHFRLETVAISSGQLLPSFEALSYTWGDATLLQEIFCGDSSTDPTAALQVTANCYNALRSLRYTDRARPLWIDAVCIDQTNVEERNAQVKLMGLIFAAAQEVVVYLGESADDSDVVMEWYKNDYDVSDYPRKDVSVSKPSLKARNAFAKRAWFTRTWTLQEVANARSVVIKCGALTMPWEAYSRGFETMNSNVQEVLRLFIRIRTPDDAAPESILLDVLKATRNCISSDPRDKIFGTLPLIPQHLIPSSLRPNYNISSQELFVRVAAYLYPWLGPPLLGEISEKQIEHLPSWVPDWSSMQKRPIKLSPRAAGGRLPDPGQTSRQASRHGTVHGEQLHIEGVRMGSLSEVASIFSLDERRRVMTEWLLTMASMLRKTSHSPESTDREQKSTYTLLFQDIVTQGKYPDLGRHVKQVIIRWCVRRNDKRNAFTWTSFHSEVFRQIMQSCSGRRFAIVGLDVIALVPAAAQPGDVVYVLAGAAVPYLLRKKEDGYLLIGECYVHGIMDGEAVDDVDASDMETVIIV